MSALIETLRRDLNSAHADALRVHDSPVRADRLLAQIEQIAQQLPTEALGEERTARISAALADARRVLRREEDGREAAKHLQVAIRQLTEAPPRPPSPFLDDL